MANQEPLATVSIRCLCGEEIDRVSTNVLGLTTTIQCKSCGRDNEFKHSLLPAGAKDQRPFPEESLPIRT